MISSIVGSITQRVARSITGAHGGGAAPLFSRKNSIVIDTLLGITNGSVWDYAKQGDYLYMAADTEGCYVVDVSDPENPVQTDSTTLRMQAVGGGTISMPCTDVLINGDYLFMCGRTVDWDITNVTGVLTIYDISNPASPSYVVSYQPPDMSPRPIAFGTSYGNNWYQGMCASETHLFIASQFEGLTVFDISDMGGVGLTLVGSHTRYQLFVDFQEGLGVHNGGDNQAVLSVAGTPFTTNALVGDRVTNLTQRFEMLVDSNTTNTITGTIEGVDGSGVVDWDDDDIYIINERYKYWETSRCAYHDGWVYMATHGNGVMAVDVSDPTDPTNVQWYDAPVVDPFGDGNEQLRERYVITDGNYIYCCNNHGTAEPERGLIIMDISDPTAVDVDDWIYEPIGKSYNETSTVAGDRQIMRLAKYGDYVYLGNGDRGQAVFDVTDPTTPIMKGLKGTNTPADTSTYGAYFFESGGKTYCYYSDCKEAGTQKHNLYIDEVIGAPATEYIIGLHTDDAPSASQEIATNTTIELSSAEQRPIVIAEWSEVYEVGCFAASSSGASRVAVIGLFNAVLDSGVKYLPTTAVQDNGADVEAAISIPGGTTKAEHTDAVSFLIPPGTYMLKAVSSGLTQFLDNRNVSSYHRYRYSSGTYPDLVDPTAAATNRTSGDMVIWMKTRSISS